jgi:hypothetical protein
MLTHLCCLEKKIWAHLCPISGDIEASIMYSCVSGVGSVGGGGDALDGMRDEKLTGIGRCLYAQMFELFTVDRLLVEVIAVIAHERIPDDGLLALGRPEDLVLLSSLVVGGRPPLYLLTSHFAYRHRYNIVDVYLLVPEDRRFILLVVVLAFGLGLAALRRLGSRRISVALEVLHWHHRRARAQRRRHRASRRRGHHGRLHCRGHRRPAGVLVEAAAHRQGSRLLLLPVLARSRLKVVLLLLILLTLLLTRDLGDEEAMASRYSPVYLVILFGWMRAVVLLAYAEARPHTVVVSDLPRGLAVELVKMHHHGGLAVGWKARDARPEYVILVSVVVVLQGHVQVKLFPDVVRHDGCRVQRLLQEHDVGVPHRYWHSAGIIQRLR